MVWIVDRAQDDIDPEVTEHPQRGVNVPGDKSAKPMSTKHSPQSGKIRRTDQEDGTNRMHCREAAGRRVPQRLEQRNCELLGIVCAIKPLRRRRSRCREAGGFRGCRESL